MVGCVLGTKLRLGHVNGDLLALFLAIVSDEEEDRVGREIRWLLELDHDGVNSGHIRLNDDISVLLLGKEVGELDFGIVRQESETNFGSLLDGVANFHGEQVSTLRRDVHKNIGRLLRRRGWSLVVANGSLQVLS